MKLIYTMLLLLLITACQSSADNKREADLESRENLSTWSLEEIPEWALNEQRTLQARNEKHVNRIDHLTVAENGNIFFYAAYLQKVEVMDPSGKYLGTAAKLGGDPGEFRQLTYISTSGGKLYLLDAGSRKVEIFDTSSLEYLDTVIIPEGSSLYGNPTAVFALSGDNLLLKFEENLSSDDREVHYSIFSEKGEPVKEQFYSEKMSDLTTDPTGEVPVVFSLPTDRKSLVAVNRDHIIIANSDQLLLSLYDHSGNYDRSYYYPFDNLDVNKADVIDEYDDAKMRRAIRGESLPDEWPALDAILTDEKDRIWLSTICGDHKSRKWISLSPEGKPEGSFDLPGVTAIMEMEQGRFYSKYYNRRFYSDQIRLYTIDR